MVVVKLLMSPLQNEGIDIGKFLHVLKGLQFTTHFYHQLLPGHENIHKFELNCIKFVNIPVPIANCR
jgi:hypothetical protein